MLSNFTLFLADSLPRGPVVFSNPIHMLVHVTVAYANCEHVARIHLVKILISIYTLPGIFSSGHTCQVLTYLCIANLCDPDLHACHLCQLYLNKRM